MSVEDDFEEYARRIAASRNEEKSATDDDAKQRVREIRSVLFMNVEGLIARSPQALQAKAQMVWDEDWTQNPTFGGASFVRSLLSDLLQWKP